MNGIVAQLQDYYPDAAFMVFNFKEGDMRSQLSDLLSEYGMTVMDYPQKYEGCSLLPLEVIHHFLRSSESWLSVEGQQNVLLMHCERGGWPVLAFMLAGLLLYRKQSTGEQKTLEMVYKQAPKELLHILTSLNPQPSQLRYLQYISRRNFRLDWPQSDAPLALVCIILRALPLYDGGRGCRPVVRVYGPDPSSETSNRSSKLLFSTSEVKKHIRLYQQEECELVKINIRCLVQGDVVLQCSHLEDDLVTEKKVFRIMFHTEFVRSNVLILTSDEVDVLWDTKDQISREFRAEVLFADTDAFPSIITTKTASGDDNEPEVASPEEFFEAEEIFSSLVDGQDSKGEFDNHNIQVSAQDDESHHEVAGKDHLEHHTFQDCASDEASHRHGRKVDPNSNLMSNGDVRPDSSSVIAHVDSTEETKSENACRHDKSEEEENNQSKKPILMKKIEKQGSQQKIAADNNKQKLDSTIHKKQRVSRSKSASDAVGSKKSKLQDLQSPLARQAKPSAVSRWIPSNRGSYTNSMHVYYPPSRHNSAPAMLALGKDSPSDGKSKIHSAITASEATTTAGRISASGREKQASSQSLSDFSQAEDDSSSALPSKPLVELGAQELCRELMSPSPSPPLNSSPPPPPPPQPTLPRPSTRYIFTKPTSPPTRIPHDVELSLPPPPPPPPQLVPPRPSTRYILTKPTSPPARIPQDVELSLPPPPLPAPAPLCVSSASTLPSFSSRSLPPPSPTLPPPPPSSISSTSIFSSFPSRSPLPPPPPPPPPWYAGSSSPILSVVSDSPPLPTPPPPPPSISCSSIVTSFLLKSPSLPPPSPPPLSSQNMTCTQLLPSPPLLPPSQPLLTINSSLRTQHETPPSGPNPPTSSYVESASRVLVPTPPLPPPSWYAVLSTVSNSPSFPPSSILSTSIVTSFPPKSLLPAPPPPPPVSQIVTSIEILPPPPPPSPPPSWYARSFSPVLSVVSNSPPLPPPPPPLIHAYSVQSYTTAEIPSSPPTMHGKLPPPPPPPPLPTIQGVPSFTLLSNPPIPPPLVSAPPPVSPLFAVVPPSPFLVFYGPSLLPSPPLSKITPTPSIAPPICGALQLASPPCGAPPLPLFRALPHLFDAPRPSLPHTCEACGAQTPPPLPESPIPTPPPMAEASPPPPPLPMLEAPPPPSPPPMAEAPTPPLPPSMTKAPPLPPSLPMAEAPPPPPPPPPMVGAPPPPPSSGGAPPPPPPPPPGGALPPPPPPPMVGAPPPPPLPVGALPPPPPPPMVGAPPPPPPPGGAPPPPPPPGGAPPPPPFPGGHASVPPAPPGAPGPGPPAPPGAPGHGPPPPPGALGGRGRGRGISAARKSNLKPLHWSKVTRALKGSLWEELQRHGEPQVAPEFDVKEIETLFSATVPKSDSSGGKAGGVQKAAASKPTKVQLIDLKRAYNVEIMLTKVKMPLPDMMSAALAMDDSILDADQVENLLKFCPKKEEMELLKGYTGDPENLGKCEQVFDLRKSLNIINSACEEVRNSLKLKEIMKKILYLGNTLNEGTARGAAIGFKLDSLSKLADTRASTSKMTLMHYLCKVLASKTPDLLDFHKDLINLEVATKIQLKSLAEEMQALTKGLEKVKQELAASETDGPVSAIFHTTLKEFVGAAEDEVTSVSNLYSTAGKNADALALYFGEDPALVPLEQVTATLLNFVRLFQKAHEENCKQAELDKKKAQKEAEVENEKGTKITKIEVKD